MQTPQKGGNSRTGPSANNGWNPKTHFIYEYEKILAANGGTTMGQEGYGTGGAYSAIYDDESSLAESIVQYAEKAT